MLRMIVTIPPVLRIKVRIKQALSMMPAITEDIVILLALRGSVLFAQAIPFAMRVFLHPFGHQGRRNNAISRSFEEEAAIHIHQAIEAQLLVDPANLRQ